MGDIASNLGKVEQRIAKACTRVGRDPSEVNLVAVSKEIEPSEIEKGISLGITEIGENRVQELAKKYAIIGDKANWHFVGHLQKNKVKYIINFIKLVQSVESLSLAGEISKRAEISQKVQDILVQVNVSGEKQKFGIAPSRVEEFLKEISGLKYISVKGLMTIAPWVEAEETRTVFAGLKGIFNQVRKKGLPNVEMKYLSMGMTNDFEVAIEEGSNMVRIGTAIFKV